MSPAADSSARDRPRSALGSWLDGHERPALVALVGAAAVVRLLLALHTPMRDGFSWDPYWRSTQLFLERGRVPAAEDCFECYQPPLGTLLGAPLFALGSALGSHPDDGARAMNLLGLTSAAIGIYLIGRILTLLGHRGAPRLLGLGIALGFPSLALASWSSDFDVLLFPIVAALVHELLRYQKHPAPRLRQAVVIGLLAGAAMATKYSGLTAMVPVAALFGTRLLVGPARSRTLGHGLAAIGVALLCGGWKYADNLRRHGEPFFDGGAAQGAYRQAPWELRWSRYDFASLKIGGALELFEARPRNRKLTDCTVYYSVWTSLHALAWSDMSYFSLPGRGSAFPRQRRVPVVLIGAVLWLALLPDAMAVAGLVHGLRRPELRLVMVLVLAAAWAYLSFVLIQTRWALKTKYLLFLLPAYVIGLANVLDLLERRAPRALMTAVLLALALLVIAVNLYNGWFALG